MKSTLSTIMTATVSALILLAISGSTSWADATQQYGGQSQQYGGQTRDQSQDKNKTGSVSEGEQKALAKVESSPDAATKIQAASEFVKKYPKSAARSKVVSHVAQEVVKIQDAAQRLAHLESISTVFKEPADAHVIEPILVEAYFTASRADDGFRVAAAYIEKNPSDLAVLTQVAIEGIEQAKKGNTKFASQSQQYGAKAIELIESGKKPEAFDDARWNDYQKQWLPILYQRLGLLLMMAGNKADARSKVEKSVALNPADPFSYVLLGSLLNDEYQQLAQQHKTLSPGPLRDTVLKQAHAKIDEVIDMFAHAVGLSQGNPALQQLHDQILQDLQSYYKYRHGGSTDGLQALIDKHKKQ